MATLSLFYLLTIFQYLIKKTLKITKKADLTSLSQVIVFPSLTQLSPMTVCVLTHARDLAYPEQY